MKLVLYFGDNTKKADAPGELNMELLDTLLKQTFSRLNEIASYVLKYWDNDVEDYIDLDDCSELYDKCKIKLVEVNPHPLHELQVASIHGMPRGETPASTWRDRSWPLKYTLPVEKFSLRLKENLKKKEELLYRCKQDLLDAIAEDMYGIAPYPTGKQITEVAQVLIEVYPHLTETLGSGYDGWKVSLINKLKKLRQDFKNSPEIKRNAATKRGRNNKLIGPGKKAKRPLKGEINWAPEIAEGEDETSLERHRDMMIKEMKKSAQLRNTMKIKASMDATYAERRDFINQAPKMIDVKERYPAFFTTTEVLEEFTRLMPKHNLNATMTSRMLILSVDIIQHMRGQQTCKKNPLFLEMLKELEHETEDLTNEKARRLNCATVVAALLPLLFRENLDLVKMAKDHAEENLQQLAKDAVHPIVIVSGSLFSTELVSLAAEGEILITCSEVTEGLICLFALYYACNIEYPATCKKTCSFIQHVFMTITGGYLPVVVVTMMERFKHALSNTTM